MTPKPQANEAPARHDTHSNHGSAEPDSANHEEHGGHQGHDGHKGHGGHDGHAEMFRRLFWANLALAVPVLVFSDQVQEWLSYDLSFSGSSWIAPVLGTVIFFYGGRPFLTGGYDEAKQRQPGMMLLIALAITVAFGASLLSLTNVLDLEFWWELASLIVIMLLGHWQEMKAIGQAQGALAALAALLPDEAERLDANGDPVIVAVADLAVGDRLLVRSGARVPADGRIIQGSVELDESMLTSESNPVAKSEGDAVVAGSIGTDNTIRIEITAVGDDTALGGIQRLVDQAQESKSRAQAIADRAAALLFYVSLVSAIITATVWLLLGEPDDALIRTVTVLIIACPHALGLAIPLVVSLSTATAARNGILVKDRLALEQMRKVDTVLFDKTGTLTAGNHLVTALHALDNDTNHLLAIAAAVEADSEHPPRPSHRPTSRERPDRARHSHQLRIDDRTRRPGDRRRRDRRHRRPQPSPCTGAHRTSRARSAHRPMGGPRRCRPSRHRRRRHRWSVRARGRDTPRITARHRRPARPRHQRGHDHRRLQRCRPPCR